MINVIIIVLVNLLVAYFISFFSYIIAVGWFCFAIGFRFGQWYGAIKKEDEFIAREEIIREEYEKK